MCVPVISSGTCDNQRIQTYMCLPVLTWGVGKSKRPFRFSCGFANQGVCRRTAHLFPKVILHVLFLMVLPLKSTGDSSFSYLHSHRWADRAVQQRCWSTPVDRHGGLWQPIRGWMFWIWVRGFKIGIGIPLILFSNIEIRPTICHSEKSLYLVFHVLTFTKQEDNPRYLTDWHWLTGWLLARIVAQCLRPRSRVLNVRTANQL